MALNWSQGALITMYDFIVMNAESAYFEGVLNADNVETFFIENKNRQFSELHITSPGGEEQHARTMANYIAENSITVVVEDLCTSACAQYILPASPRVIIQENSLVAFHTSYLALIEISTEEIADAILNTHGNQINLSRNFYLENNTPLDFIFLSTLFIQPRCFVIENSRAEFHSVAELWVPPWSYIEATFPNISGYWPSDTNEVARLVGTKMEKGAVWVYGINDEGWDIPDVSEWPKVGICE